MDEQVLVIRSTIYEIKPGFQHRRRCGFRGNDRAAGEEEKIKLFPSRCGRG
jgi:hypothetical protein